MSAPWEALVGIAGGSAVVALLLVLGGYLAKAVFDRGIARSAELHRSVLAQSAEAQKISLAQASAFDTDLRQRRIPEYTELWSLTQLLPRWPRADNVTGQDLRSLSESLRDWYFSGGGMFLSAESFKAYGDLQDRLVEFLDDHSDLVKPISGPDYDRIRQYCSTLRSELTADIVSRVQRREFSLPA
ncbi:hypothetical protein [Longimicrobium sp.]|uniref:hypothetical protein n=1 Tax=Longimicrobium sp. TaxID=2029185 RepID=UPI002B8400CC|nr:hypothetical protein [Longimicrobium sp.]HSU15018.1 hypothetical protein [Longimicrobium sp.]